MSAPALGPVLGAVLVSVIHRSRPRGQSGDAGYDFCSCPTGPAARMALNLLVSRDSLRCGLAGRALLPPGNAALHRGRWLVVCVHHGLMNLLIYVARSVNASPLQAHRFAAGGIAH